MPRPPKRDLVLLGVALLAVVAATASKLGNELVWDDLQVIARGDVIHDPANLPNVFAHRTLYVSEGFASDDAHVGVDTYRPITLVTFFADSAIGGRSPIPYHLTNLLAHLACIVLVFFLARRLLLPTRRHLAPAAAAWFGLTPHLAEAHVWIDGRSDLFVTLFGLGALLVHRRAFASSGGRRPLLFVASATLALLGLLSKEVLLLALPAFLVFPTEPELADRAPSVRARILAALPLAAAAAIYLALRFSVLSGLRASRDANQLVAALVRAPVLWLDGFAELTVPTRVYVHSMLDDYRALGLPLVLGLGALALALVGVAFAKRRALPALAWSVFFYVCTLAPAAMIATMLWPGFGRYLYLPFAGLAPGLTDALGAGFDRLRTARPDLARVPRLVIPLYLAALGLRLALYTTDYHDERTLWRFVAEGAPERAHGHGWLGATLLEEGDPAAAVPELRRATELDPGERRYLTQLGWALLLSGDRQGALDAAATGFHRFPDDAEPELLAATALADIRPDLAAEHVARCLARDPSRAECEALAARLDAR